MTGEPFEIHAPRLTTLVLGLLGLGLTGLSIIPLWLWLTGRGDPGEIGVMLPIGFVGTVFFGLATATALTKLLSPKAIMRVDEAGIHVWRYPSMSWDEFHYADAASSSGEVMLVLHSVDDAAFRARMVWYRRLWAKGNAALVDGAVYLSQRLIPGTAADLAIRINKAAPFE